MANHDIQIMLKELHSVRVKRAAFISLHSQRKQTDSVYGAFKDMAEGAGLFGDPKKNREGYFSLYKATHDGKLPGVYAKDVLFVIITYCEELQAGNIRNTRAINAWIKKSAFIYGDLKYYNSFFSDNFSKSLIEYAERIGLQI